MAALGGLILLLPARMVLSVLESDTAIEYLGTVIEPGVCAVVVVEE